MSNDRSLLIPNRKHRVRKKHLLIFIFFFGLFLIFYSQLNQNRDLRQHIPLQLTDQNNGTQIFSSLDQNNHNRNERKVIVLWTAFFGNKDYVLPLERYACPVSNCVFTSDRSLFSSADAVMFHARDTTVDDIPKTHPLEQRWILLHHEAPPSTPSNVMKHLTGKINWTVTYRLDSDVSLTPRYQRKTEQTMDSVTTESEVDWTMNKTRMIAWFVSNCRTDSRREAFVRSLQQTVPVDVFGSCGPFVCNPKMSTKCYKTIAREYRFYLSLENAICKDYATEKVFNIMDYNIIPIVLGGADYSQLLPPKSYINVLDFETSAQLGQYLISLAKDPDEYNSYFKWRSHYQLEPYEHYACAICRKLHASNESFKIWNDLDSWWFNQSDCKSWPVNKNTDEIDDQDWK